MSGTESALLRLHNKVRNLEFIVITESFHLTRMQDAN